MAGATFIARLDDAQVRRAMVALSAFGQDRGVLAAVGVVLARNTRERFDQARDPDDRPWAALHAMYAPLKRGPGILRERGMRGGLQGSITSSVQGRAVAVGTNKVYGAVHQFGGVIRAKSGGALVFRMATGAMVKSRNGRVRAETEVWRVQSVTIPARPYLGLSARDADSVREVVYDGLSRALRG